MSKRGTGISSDIDKTIVPMFLSEMDGLDSSSAIVMLATNRPDMLDPAVTRDGRIDIKVEIPRPGPRETKHIFEIHMKGKPLAPGVSLDGLSKLICCTLFDNEKRMKKITLSDSSEHFLKLGHIVNGAMVAGIVEKSIINAIRRDKENGGVPTGITEEDVSNSLEDIFMENNHLDHKDIIKDLLGGRADHIKKIEKII